ncbi:carboxymuconolactone decarboxylase family protein, partial [Actinomadura adrarensis]
MPHIAIPPELMPGTPGLMRYRQETGRPLSQLAEVLLRDDHTLSRSERELIAAYVSALNNCKFCLLTHGEVSAQQHAEGRPLIDKVLADPYSAPISPKLKALLRIAEAVQDNGHAVTAAMVADAKDAGASDLEIH